MALFPSGKGGGEDVDYGYKGKGVTIHLLAEGTGIPLAITTTPASASERGEVGNLLKQVKVRGKRGKPRSCPKEIHADKGYDSKALRKFLRSKGIRPVIPKRKWPDAKQPPGPKVAISQSRWTIERAFSWIQRKFRRLVSRWERRTLYWNAFLSLSIIMIWIDKLIYG